MRSVLQTVLVLQLLLGTSTVAAAPCPVKTRAPVAQCTPTTQPLSTCAGGEQFVPTVSTGVCRSCSTVVPESRPGYICEGGEVYLCPAGHYCPYNDTAKTYNTMIECKDGTICMPGFTAPITCSATARCEAGATNRGTAAGGFIVSAVVITMGACLACALQRRSTRLLEASFKNRDEFKAVPGQQLGAGMSEIGNPVTITFKNVGMTLKGNGAQILKGVTGYYPPGSLVALMGPSGGGKTSFMNAILGRAPYADVEGSIEVNGVRDGLKEAANVVGFVPQDDICHDDLTVYQNLYYNAITRLPSHVSIEEKKKHVQHVINVLGLAHIQNHIVGSAKQRGISGGQKKRVNIGMELVAMPSIIFMDEPTSGLDGTATLELAQCLVKLRESGLTIVCVIHQPRYTVFRTFTHLLLLGNGGQQAFSGRTEHVTTFLQEQRFRLPALENPADWIIDVVSGFSPRYKTLDGDDDRIEDGFKAPDDLYKIWADLYAADCFRPAARWNKPRASHDIHGKCKPLEARKTPNDCMQTSFFFRRVVDQHKNREFLTTSLSVWVVAAFLSSLRTDSTYSYGTLYNSLPGSTNILAMLCSIQSHTLIYRESLQYYREFKSGMSVTGYFLAKFVYDVLCTFAYSILWALACYTISPPLQHPFNGYVWLYVAFAFYWSSFGSWIAVTFTSSYTTGLLIMMFAPALEPLWSGTRAAQLGSIPIRELTGSGKLMSILSSGRWVSQGLYCGELMTLPSHVRDFQVTRETLYNVSVVAAKDTAPAADEVERGVSNAVLALILCGLLFRFLTWVSFLLTKFAQGNTRRSQLLYVVRTWCRLCKNKHFLQDEHDEVPCANHDFDHTNLHAVLRTGAPPIPVENESAIKEAHDTSTEEGVSGNQHYAMDVGTRKVIPTDSSIPESNSADQMRPDVVLTVNDAVPKEE